MGKVYQRTKASTSQPRKPSQRKTSVKTSGKGNPAAQTTKTTRYSAPKKKSWRDFEPGQRVSKNGTVSRKES
jgi:hypothetical protein